MPSVCAPVQCTADSTFDGTHCGLHPPRHWPDAAGVVRLNATGMKAFVEAWQKRETEERKVLHYDHYVLSFVLQPDSYHGQNLYREELRVFRVTSLGRPFSLFDFDTVRWEIGRHFTVTTDETQCHAIFTDEDGEDSYLTVLYSGGPSPNAQTV